MEQTYSIFNIANWFLSKENMSHKKLQKLCWYAYSWFIALNYNPEDEDIEDILFSDSVAEAWVHGPVFNELFADYKHYGYEKTLAANTDLADETIKFLENVWEVYGGNSGDELEMISHQELPWINARSGLAPFEISRRQINLTDILTEYLPRLG